MSKFELKHTEEELGAAYANGYDKGEETGQLNLYLI
jgi:hypothetical protein